MSTKKRIAKLLSVALAVVFILSQCAVSFAVTGPTSSENMASETKLQTAEVTPGAETADTDNVNQQLNATMAQGTQDSEADDDKDTSSRDDFHIKASNTHTITYHNRDGAIIEQLTQSVNVGEKFTHPSETELLKYIDDSGYGEYYKFTGWALSTENRNSATKLTDVIYNDASNLDFYAVYGIKKATQAKLIVEDSDGSAEVGRVNLTQSFLKKMYDKLSFDNSGSVTYVGGNINYMLSQLVKTNSDQTSEGNLYGVAHSIQSFNGNNQIFSKNDYTFQGKDAESKVNELPWYKVVYDKTANEWKVYASLKSSTAYYTVEFVLSDKAEEEGYRFADQCSDKLLRQYSIDEVNLRDSETIEDFNIWLQKGDKEQKQVTMKMKSAKSGQNKNTSEAVSFKAGQLISLLDDNNAAVPNDELSTTVFANRSTVIIEVTTEASLKATGGTWQYDGTAKMASAAVSGADADEYEIEYKTENGAWKSTVPSIKDVSEGEVKVKVRAVSEDHKTLTTELITLKITPKPATVAAENKSKPVGAKDPELTVKEKGLLNNDKVTYDLSREDGEDAGEYIIMPAGEKEQGNYSITYKTGTLTISEAYVPAEDPQAPAEDTPLTPLAITPAGNNVPAVSAALVTAVAPTTAIADEPAPLATIEDEKTPKAALDSWALVNLLLTIFAVLMSLASLIFYFTKKRSESLDDEYDRLDADHEDNSISKRRLISRILGGVLAIAMVAIFLITEDMSLPMTMIDEWTLMMGIMIIVQIAAIIFGKRLRRNNVSIIKNF